VTCGGKEKFDREESAAVIGVGHFFFGSAGNSVGGPVTPQKGVLFFGREVAGKGVPFPATRCRGTRGRHGVSQPITTLLRREKYLTKAEKFLNGTTTSNLC